MQKSDFIKCCRSVEHGSEIFLDNVVDNKRGKVLFCTNDKFHVDIDGSRDSWFPQICRISS